MKIDNLKQLRAVLKLCRQEGVDTLEIDNVKLVLGTKPQANAKRKAILPISEDYELGNITEDLKIPVQHLDTETDGPTEEQILFGSSDPSVWQEQ